MSGSTWVIADLHLGHNNILNFKRDDGSPLRSFKDIEHMHNIMVENWNAVVNPVDRVYVLGDVCINRNNLHHLNRFSGRKVLVKGNHDIFKLKDYLPYFDDIRSCVVGGAVGGRYILSHIPIHPGSLGRFERNIHGHLHYGRVRHEGNQVPDERYICVSVEHTNYKPVLLSHIIEGKWKNEK